jgi:hydroxymethylpyrimidine pyrophosphatase-like HAD family hydrolase
MSLEPEWNLVYADYTKGFSEDTPKVSAECADEKLLRGILRDYPDLHLYSNHGENWRQITRRDASKANAAKFIAQSLGFDLDEVLAFGDDYNDVELLRDCAVGVAVSNAVEDAKNAADYICGSNDEDGVAKWIEERVLRA